MGPCPKCRRHVLLAEHRCPFCGATWLRSAAAAVSILLGSSEALPAPVSDAPRTAAEQAQEYGVERPPVDRKIADWVWAGLYGDWKGPYGFSPVTSSWGGRSAGANVDFLVTDGKKSHRLTVALDRVDERQAALSIKLDEYRIGAKLVSVKPAIPEEASATKMGSQVLEIDKEKYECSILRYEWPGVDVRVWKWGDRILRVESAQEKSRFVKTEEIEAAKRKMRCEVWETVRGDVTILEWRSEEVPGSVVRWESGSKRILLTSFSPRR